MITHRQVWQAIDVAAREHGMSPSGLAKKAGLDATTFNKSKRYTHVERPRWPSMESIVKILAALDMDFITFAQYLEQGSQSLRLGKPIPRINFDRRSFKHHIEDNGQFHSIRDETIDLLSPQHEALYAITLSNADYAPAYCEGETLVLSTQAPLFIGCRFLALSYEGLVVLATLLDENDLTYIVDPIANSTRAASLPKSALKCAHRILWVGQ